MSRSAYDRQCRNRDDCIRFEFDLENLSTDFNYSISINYFLGNDGLGFKLASRDNLTGVRNPKYVKTIFPKGAAIEDGHLQRDDCLLTVNSIDVTHMSLQETVGLLRDTRVGDTVELIVSRQCDGSLSQDFVSLKRQSR